MEIVASAGTRRDIPLEALLACSNAYSSATVFTTDTSGLEPYLGPTSSHLFLPLRSTERPFFAIVASSSTPHYAFPPVDVNMLRSVGSVLRARAVQHQVLLADAAKTSFLSSISHELRTPMHGVKAALELLRRSKDEDDVAGVEDSLSLAESSGRALLNILNDVLDFGKNGWAEVEEQEVDLALSAEEIGRVCLAYYGEQLGPKGTVRIEYEERNWRVKISEARYHR
jgi:signal transduction histidine kinase